MFFLKLRRLLAAPGDLWHPLVCSVQLYKLLVSTDETPIHRSKSNLGLATWGHRCQDTVWYCSSVLHYVICSLLYVAQSSLISTQDHAHRKHGAPAVRILRKSYGNVTFLLHLKASRIKCTVWGPSQILPRELCSERFLYMNQLNSSAGVPDQPVTQPVANLCQYAKVWKQKKKKKKSWLCRL